MSEKRIREIFYYRRYYLNFFESLEPDVQKKFNWTLQLLVTLVRVPKKYFEHISGSTGLYEVRIEMGSNIYRVFSFFDEGKLIILLNGFQKKAQKTPRNEIRFAEKLKRQYFDEKEKL